MKQRTLGRTGIQVSEISFGGVEIGIPYGIGIKSQADMPSDAEAMKLLQAALDRGINFFDTARAYGRSEEIIGRALKGNRERAVICTKCGHLLKENGQLPHSEQIRVMIDRSLQASLWALQTDYLDVFMLHSADLDTLHNQTVADTFLELKKKGHIRATGVSTYTVEETILAIAKGIWDVIQLSFNLMDQRQAALFDRARAAGIGLVVRSVLLKGILSDRGRNLHAALKAVEDHRSLYQDLLGPGTPTLSILATKFALSYSQVASVLVGMDRMLYLDQAVATTDGDYLDEEILARAEKLAFPNPEFIDLPNWNRMGWLK